VFEAWLEIRQLAAEQLEAIEELARAYLGGRDELEEVGREELEDRMERGDLVLIDVRPGAEFASGHIRGAISIPPNQLERLDDLVRTVESGTDIVAYCRGPYCVFADDAIRYLGVRGRHAMRLLDGVPEWRRAGGVVDT
jgi:rhodanese-related sulfurtransferase